MLAYNKKNMYDDIVLNCETECLIKFVKYVIIHKNGGIFDVQRIRQQIDNT